MAQFGSRNAETGDFGRLGAWRIRTQSVKTRTSGGSGVKRTRRSEATRTALYPAPAAGKLPLLCRCPLLCFLPRNRHVLHFGVLIEEQAPEGRQHGAHRVCALVECADPVKIRTRRENNNDVQG